MCHLYSSETVVQTSVWQMHVFNFQHMDSLCDFNRWPEHLQKEGHNPKKPTFLTLLSSMQTARCALWNNNEKKDQKNPNKSNPSPSSSLAPILQSKRLHHLHFWFWQKQSGHMWNRHKSYDLMCCWDEVSSCGGTHTRWELQRVWLYSLRMAALGKQWTWFTLSLFNPDVPHIQVLKRIVPVYPAISKQRNLRLHRIWV